MLSAWMSGKGTMGRLYRRVRGRVADFRIRIGARTVWIIAWFHHGGSTLMMAILISGRIE
jgi:hypothetical protein